VVGQAEPNSIGDNVMVEGALFDSGRPVLIVSYIQRSGLRVERATVCSDGSRSAARVVNDALPFLTKAEAVDVVTVTGEKDATDVIRFAEIAQHLAGHGLKVELRQITVGDLDVTNAILSDAAERGTDFIVMGAMGIRGSGNSCLAEQRRECSNP
jgi:nucleotide-binding universal stress UspA family protein